MVKYSYDAWGNHIAITDGNDNDVSGDPYHIANINPYRYRGYRFDIETGLYYLQSRYYDPEIGRFISMDDTKILMLTQGELLGANLFAYCNNNPVMFMDPTGYGPVGVVIGAILGFGLGAILSPYIADLIGLKGWKRTVFIWGGTAVITALGAWAGYYIGEAIFKIYKAGGAFASKINEAIIKGITKLVGGSVKAASGNGWTLNVGKLVVRLMNTGGGRTCYIHLSVAGKMAYDIFGNVVNDAAKTHIPITIENIVRLVALIFKLK